MSDKINTSVDATTPKEESGVLKKLSNFKSPFEAEDEKDTVQKRAKFIKAVTFFDNTPSVFISAFFEFKTPEKHERWVVQNPPYNMIKSFNYDVVEGKVDLELIDASGTLLTKLITNFLAVEKFSGTLKMSVRYGWSRPKFPIKEELVDDVLNPSVKSFDPTTDQIKPQVHFTDFITFIIEDIEFDWQPTGVILKITGHNSFAQILSPRMANFTPYKKFGAFPFIEEGLFESFADLEKELKASGGNIEKTIKALQASEWFENDPDAYNKINKVIANILTSIKNAPEFKKDNDKTEAEIETAIKNRQTIFKRLNDLIKQEIDAQYKNSNTAQVLKNSLTFDFFLLKGKSKTLDSWDLLRRMVKKASSHAFEVDSIKVVPLFFISNPENVNKAPSKTPKQEVAEWGKVEVKNLMVIPSTSYEEFFKTLSSYVKITTEEKDKDGKIEVVTRSLNFLSFVAHGMDEIKRNLKRFFTFVTNISTVQSQDKPKETKQDKIIKRFLEGFAEFNNLDFDNTKKIILDVDVEQFIETASKLNDYKNFFTQATPVMIFYIFSEYDTKDFLTDPNVDLILHTYNYRPGGFPMGLASGSIGGKKLITPIGTIDDLRYFNSGTLNSREGNLPDVISFTPKLSYRAVQTAMSGLIKDVFVDVPKLLLTTSDSKVSQAVADEQGKELLANLKDLKASQNQFNFDRYLQTSAIANSNTIYGSNSTNALRVRASIENFTRLLASKLVGFEAELKILGEAFYDKSQITKIIELKVYGPDGTDTPFSGFYNINGIAHSIDSGKFETTLKLLKVALPAKAMQAISNAPVSTTGGGGGSSGNGGKNPIPKPPARKWFYVVTHTNGYQNYFNAWVDVQTESEMNRLDGIWEKTSKTYPQGGRIYPEFKFKTKAEANKKLEEVMKNQGGKTK
jgi:hypothetical protein